MTADYANLHPSFRYDEPRPGVLRITFDAPGLNSVGPEAHRDIAEVWTTVDRDPDVQVVILQGAGKGFSSGGSFDLIDGMIDDYERRTQVMREARDLVWNV
ncbi:MAG: enoyl-CoA hydratase, partial [Acidimicrobiaceae bacterium]|nr:enoyl-CoA hydratase [Acidimicrobiaceae bacterium]